MSLKNAYKLCILLGQIKFCDKKTNKEATEYKLNDAYDKLISAGELFNLLEIANVSIILLGIKLDFIANITKKQRILLRYIVNICL